VVRYDPSSGRPMPFDQSLYEATVFDIPLRWLDDAIPDPFPDRDRSLQTPWNYRPLWGYYYEAIGDWKFGPLKSILPEGQVIDHRSWRGDDWEFTVAV